MMLEGKKKPKMYQKVQKLHGYLNGQPITVHLLQLFDLSFTEFQDDKRTRVKKETTLYLILGFGRSIVLKTQHQFLLS